VWQKQIQKLTKRLRHREKGWKAGWAQAGHTFAVGPPPRHPSWPATPRHLRSETTEEKSRGPLARGGERARRLPSAAASSRPAQTSGSAATDCCSSGLCFIDHNSVRILNTCRVSDLVGMGMRIIFIYVWHLYLIWTMTDTVWIFFSLTDNLMGT
jgi:hypothetical protein